MKQFAENEVSIQALVDSCESAYIKVIEKNNESFRIEGENLKVRIFIDETRHFLQLSIIYLLSGKISLSDAVALANKVNDEFIFIKFAVFENEGDIYIESRYYMTYETGLIVFHLIHMIKKFEKYTVDALREYFNDYL